jgi:XTP/dITP diphosphohydrolase
VTLYCATTNRGKLREFQLILSHHAGGAVAVEPLEAMRTLPPCAEHGATFEANAVEKALYYSKHAREPLFADDSGLEVGSLGGAPGVRSARYSGENATDYDNNALLLASLVNEPRRSARFVCVIALAEAGRLVKTFHGRVEGEILRATRGSEGFGYDPLFYYPPFGCSFGEIPAERKMTVSHRGAAVRAMADHVLSVQK